MSRDNMSRTGRETYSVLKMYQKQELNAFTNETKSYWTKIQDEPSKSVTKLKQTKKKQLQRTSII